VVSGFRANQFEVDVQARAELVEDWLDFGNLIFAEEFALEGAAKPVFRFLQGTACDARKSTILLITAATVAFRDVGSNTVRSTNELFPDSNELFPDSVACRRGSLYHDFPDVIRQPLSQLIYSQVLKIRFRHASQQSTKPCLAPTDN
jgi:hypothetical protein